MAQVKIEAVVDSLDSEFKKVLDDTMEQFAPGVSFDTSELFRFFLKRVYSRCSVWELMRASRHRGCTLHP